MKERLWMEDPQDPYTVKQVLVALLDHLKLEVYRTDETQQGRKHGIVSIEVEPAE